MHQLILPADPSEFIMATQCTVCLHVRTTCWFLSSLAQSTSLAGPKTLRDKNVRLWSNLGCLSTEPRVQASGKIRAKQNLPIVLVAVTVAPGGKGWSTATLPDVHVRRWELLIPYSTEITPTSEITPTPTFEVMNLSVSSQLSRSRKGLAVSQAGQL